MATLGQEFDPRNNALNAWRLTLAAGVILWHSFLLTDHYHGLWAPVHQLLRDGWVDGFFAISGFLITGSWFNNPRGRTYFAARGLRILPGLWVCLTVTAFVIAPLSVAVRGGSAMKLLLSWAPVEFVLSNSAVVPLRQDVGGTPNGVLWAHVWNGSLWTLLFEVVCYAAVAALGVVGLLRQRWFVPLVLVLTLVWSALLPPWAVFGEAMENQEKVDAATAALLVQAVTARLFTMFLAGALLYQLRNVVPARWSLVTVSAALVGAALLMPNYRLLGAIPFAYAIIVSGVLLRRKWLRLRTDLSYGVYIYAFPVQQLLLVWGLNVTPVLFAVIAAVATLPVAAASWFAVEKPALSLKTRLKPRDCVSAAVPQRGA